MASAPDFCTTQWNMVALAGATPSPAAEAALERLCGAYWMPVYAFIRRQGHQPEDAEDLTQDFFAELLGRRGLAGLDPARGKFRAFLVACLKHFLAKDWRARQTLKRGGGRTFVPMDVLEAEARCHPELSTAPDASALFDRQWALSVLDQALSALRTEQAAAGRGEVFEELKVCLTPTAADTTYEEPARRLSMTPGAVATAVHRLRQRYRALVRTVVAQTVAGPLELEDELRHLLHVLRP